MIPPLEARRRGGRTRAQQFDSAYQSWARSHVSSEACARNGRKGALVVLEKYGFARLHQKVRTWRLAHPSALERRVIALLAELGQQEGEHYQREYEPFATGPIATVDFAWPEHRLVLEVDGPVHRLFDPDGRRGRREAERLARLREAGWRIVVLDAEAVHGLTAALLAARLGLAEAPGEEAVA